MNHYDNIDYSDHTLDELYQSRAGVYKERYPNNASQIDHYIKIREGTIPEDSPPPARTPSPESRSPDSSTATPVQIVYRYLSVSGIISRTLDYCWANRASIFSSLKYPGIFLLVLSAAQSTLFSDDERLIYWLLSIGQVFATTIFTIRCHRIFLLSEGPLEFYDVMSWSMRETWFVLYEIGLALAAGLLIILPSMFIVPMIFILAFNSSWLFSLAAIVPFILGGYVFSRFTLVLPAVATDQEGSFATAWNTSGGNGWKIFALICVLPAAIAYLTGKIPGHLWIATTITPVVNLLVLLVEIIALSHIFKELTSQGNGVKI